MTNQIKDYEWFLSQRDELLKTHYGESVIISNGEILAFCKDDSEALRAVKEMGLKSGEYIVQQCLPPEVTDFYYYTAPITCFHSKIQRSYSCSYLKCRHNHIGC